MTYFYCLKSDIHVWSFADEKNSFLDEKSLHFRTKNSLITPLFTQFVLTHASNNTTSRNIWGTDTWAVPHLKFWEGPSPISFRPWLPHIANKFDDIHNSGDNETWRLYCEKPSAHDLVDLWASVRGPIKRTVKLKWKFPW